MQLHIHAAQPISHDLHHLQGKIGSMMYMDLETVLIDRDQFTVRLSNRSGAAAGSINEGHLPQNSSGANSLQKMIAKENIDFTLLDNIHHLTRFPFPEDC